MRTPFPITLLWSEVEFYKVCWVKNNWYHINSHIQQFPVFSLKEWGELFVYEKLVYISERWMSVNRPYFPPNMVKSNWAIWLWASTLFPPACLVFEIWSWQLRRRGIVMDFSPSAQFGNLFKCWCCPSLPFCVIVALLSWWKNQV